MVCLVFFFFCCCVCVCVWGGNIPDVYFLRFFLKIFQSKEFNLLSEQCRANFNVYTGHPRNCWNADSDSGGLGQGWDAVSSLQLLPCSMDASCLKFRSLLIYFWLYWVFGCTQAFCSCGQPELLFMVACGFLIAVASPIAEHRLQIVSSWASTSPLVAVCGI